MTSNRPARRLLACMGLLASTALLVACGSEETEPPAPAPMDTTRPAAPERTPAPRATEGDRPMAGAEESPAEQLRRTVDLPDDYPSDAPVYPGAKPSQVSQTAEGRYTVIFGTEDSPEEAMDYMMRELPGSGWQVSGQRDLPTGKLVQAMKGERLVSVLISRLDEGRDTAVTMIAVSVDS